MAFGQGTVSNIGGAVSDLFAAKATATGLRLKSRGNVVEANLYQEASDMARQNAEFTRQSTEVQQVQSERQIMRTIGAQEAQVASAGFSASGSALDLLRSSAQQGALTHQLIGQQGLITEAGYEQQAKSYVAMAGAARDAATTQNDMANKAITAGNISAGFKVAAGITSIFV